MASAARPARSGYVLGALAFAVTSGLLLSSAPASSNGGGPGCGRVVKSSIRLNHDLLACPAEGLIVGAHGITIDLNGKVVDGVSFGVGIVNDGFDGVTIRNGRIQDFDYGIQLNSGARRNHVTRLTISGNELAGVQLFNAAAKNRITNSIIELQAGDGVAIIDGSSGNRVVGNTIRNNQNNGVFVQRSSGNRIARNGITGNSDRNIQLDFHAATRC
jgi:parallel beta-helix repeat protein